MPVRSFLSSRALPHTHTGLHLAIYTNTVAEGLPYSASVTDTFATHLVLALAIAAGSGNSSHIRPELEGAIHHLSARTSWAVGPLEDVPRPAQRLIHLLKLLMLRPRVYDLECGRVVTKRARAGLTMMGRGRSGEADDADLRHKVRVLLAHQGGI